MLCLGGIIKVDKNIKIIKYGKILEIKIDNFSKGFKFKLTWDYILSIIKSGDFRKMVRIAKDYFIHIGD